MQRIVQAQPDGRCQQKKESSHQWHVGEADKLDEHFKTQRQSSINSASMVEVDATNNASVDLDKFVF